MCVKTITDANLILYVSTTAVLLPFILINHACRRPDCYFVLKCKWIADAFLMLCVDITFI